MSLRKISARVITETVSRLCIEANYDLPENIIHAFDQALKDEKSVLGKEILKELKKNAEISGKEQIPLCQDCGLAVIFFEMGQEVQITGGDLREAINEGVKQGYKKGFLRKSVCHPFTRKNTGNNIPAIIHFNIVPGDKITIRFAPKGGGSENMSRLKMLTPASGIEGVKSFVIESVKEAGSNPCPPIIVGIGIGGTFERSAFIAKKALLRDTGKRNADKEIADIETELFYSINKLGIGPMGYGGTTTCLDVFMEIEPCHIASLPVSVNINCHSSRHKEAVI